ncbi:MAG: helix-turn-helix transcriptional regulator [Clostridiales bacterium]|jgi:transcriptional regulator with XRE-family HTH domain|nr:helix-turn-helix transcriptional regulator [Clostridiales bacterium]
MKICINERLRELRVKSGYTQYQIAKILSIDRSTYSYYEIGKTMPDITVLLKLSKIFNLPINELLEDEVSPENIADSGIKSHYYHSKKNASHIYELSGREKDLVGAFRVCSSEEQDKILEFIQEQTSFKGKIND